MDIKVYQCVFLQYVDFFQIVLGSMIRKSFEYIDSYYIMQIEESYQIQSSEFKVKLKKKYLKIFNLLPAADNTFVFLGMVGVGVNRLVHTNSLGDILYQHKFTKIVDSISLLDNRTVIVLQSRLNHILLIDLMTHTASEIPFQFMNQESDQSTVFCFGQTQFTCVVEYGRYNDNRLKLSYYKYPLNTKSTPFNVYESDAEWCYQYLLRKGNEDSMIIWHKTRNDQEIELKTYKIVKQVGTFNNYKVKNQIGAGYGEQSELQLAITNVWQVEVNKFCLVCISQKSSLGYKNAEGVINDNYMWDVETNEFRQAKFWFSSKYSDFLIDNHYFGQFSIFRTYYYHNGTVEQSPCYYVHNKSQRVVASDLWCCTYKTKFEYPIFDHIIVEGEYQNGEVSEFKMKVKRLIEKKK